MKNVFLIFLSLILILPACQDDEPSIDADLFYDTGKNSAPFFDPGTQEVGARFTSAQTADFIGRNLEEVAFYMVNRPTQCEVRIYGEGTASQPGNLLYSADVSNSIRTDNWNTHILLNPVEITGDDLWICLRVTHDSESNTVGCDAGPAKNNGDWMYVDADNEWKTFRERTNEEVSINWNIRGKVSEL